MRFFPIVILGLLFAFPASGNNISVGGQTSQPIGHYEFCKILPAECAIRPKKTGPVVLTVAVEKLITSVNIKVNRKIRPLNDIDIYGRDEVWAYPDNGSGDCEDFALEKRRELNQAGISLANLLITVVRKPDGEGHAVLTVRTSAGDRVLDNLHDDVLDWRDTGYRFLKRQASYHTGRWVSLRFPENDLLATADTD